MPKSLLTDKANTDKHNTSCGFTTISVWLKASLNVTVFITRTHISRQILCFLGGCGAAALEYTHQLKHRAPLPHLHASSSPTTLIMCTCHKSESTERSAPLASAQAPPPTGPSLPDHSRRRQVRLQPDRLTPLGANGWCDGDTGGNTDSV